MNNRAHEELATVEDADAVEGCDIRPGLIGPSRNMDASKVADWEESKKLSARLGLEIKLEHSWSSGPAFAIYDDGKQIRTEVAAHELLSYLQGRIAERKQ